MALKIEDAGNKLIIRANTGIIVGKFQWHSRWKQYVFIPVGGNIYASDVLVEIANKCTELTKSRSENVGT